MEWAGSPLGIQGFICFHRSHHQNLILPSTATSRTNSEQLLVILSDHTNARLDSALFGFVKIGTSAIGHISQHSLAGLLRSAEPREIMPPRSVEILNICGWLHQEGSYLLAVELNPRAS
jgi:hypothetical protein